MPNQEKDNQSSLIQELRIQIAQLKQENERLKQENQFLRQQHSIGATTPLLPSPPPPLPIFAQSIEWKKATPLPSSSSSSLPSSSSSSSFCLTTVKNETAKRKRLLRQRFTTLSSIPEQSGAFIFTFPNGKMFVGEATNLRQVVKRRLTELFPQKKTLLERARNSRPLYYQSWMEQAIRENPSAHSFEDLDIRAVVCENPAFAKKKLLSETEGEFYNMMR